MRDLHSSACDTLHRRYPLLGQARVHHTNKRAQPMTYGDKPYLIPLMAMLPTLRHAVFCKGVQTGLSEMLIAYMLHAAGWNDRICAYVLPQYKTSERFVADRIDPLILRTPAYSGRQPGGLFGASPDRSKGNLKRKPFGRRGSLLFLGANTPSDFLEFSCDVAVVDEFDECSYENVANIGNRQRESAAPQVFFVSNPRRPGAEGITRAFQEGSQARWFHQCPRCNERQWMDWYSHFVEKGEDGHYRPRDREREHAPGLGDLRPVCQRCARPWDRVADGSVWVAAYDRPEKSFHNSRLDVLSSQRDPQPMRAGFAEFVRARLNPKAAKAFSEGFLGKLHAPPGHSITAEMIRQAAADQPPMDYEGGDDYIDRTVTMGVDVGAVLNVRISWLDPVEIDGEWHYRRHGIWIGAVPDFDDLIALQARYHVDVMTIDALPETREAKRIRDHYNRVGGCTVWLALYSSTPKVGTQSFGIVLKADQSVVVDRTQLLDATMVEMANGLAPLPCDIDTVLHFSDQMRAPKRTINDKSRAVWKEGGDPDHYRHADAYDRVSAAIHDLSGGYYE